MYCRLDDLNACIFGLFFALLSRKDLLALLGNQLLLLIKLNLLRFKSVLDLCELASHIGELLLQLGDHIVC